MRQAVDGMLTLRASKVVVSVRKRSLMCRGKSLVSRVKPRILSPARLPVPPRRRKQPEATKPASAAQEKARRCPPQHRLFFYRLIAAQRIGLSNESYGRGGGVGRSLGVGIILGVGDNRGVEVGVGVGVRVAVGVGVGVLAPDGSLSKKASSWEIPLIVTRPSTHACRC